MIQNILTFCVKNDLTYVSGSIPSGKLVANDVNRNSIYLITPYDEAIVKANFQTNLQSDTPTSVLGILVNGEIEVGELVDTNASYYNLVKDWNIYEFKVPSTTLSFISRNRTGKIGINFSIEQRLVPMIKVSYGTYKGEITELAQTPTENGYYIIKALGYEYEDSESGKSFDLNDILVYNATTDVATKISAYSNRGSSPTALYSVDPSLLNDNFETITPSLTAQIVQQVNDNTGDILLLNQGVLNDGVAITDLQNRMSVAESDIDTAEANIVNLQGRMATAESDIDKIEDGTTIVEKALRDSLGNVIKDHYVASVIPTYDDNTNNLYLNPYNGNDSLMPTRIEGVNLPKATTLKDGLMAKEDKVKVDNVASDISSAITTHDGSVVAHLHLRTLINDLQKEIDRLNAKGRSWGEVDKTFSELWAMTEPTRSEYITDYLLIEFPDFVATDGDLVYTKNTDTEEEHELEFNSALSQWVDNGAYIVGKASNTQMGIVKGDLTYVSILNGIIQVLKSDYATNVGSSGASYDYADLLALFTEVANDIYKKNETYSATQIEQRLTDLLALANLQDVLIGTYTNGQSVLASDLSPYNFIVALGKDTGTISTGIFKPSEINPGEAIYISSTVYLSRGSNAFTAITPTSIKLWGIKLDGIGANEISYDNSTSGLVADKVQGAIDEVVVELNTLDTKIDTEVATLDLVNTRQDIRINEIEELARKSASGETSDNVLGTDVVPLSKDTANAPMSVEVDGAILEAPNLIVNGDFSNGTTGWTSYASTSTVSNGNLTNTATGSNYDPTIFQDTLPIGDIVYGYSRVKVNGSAVVNLTIRMNGSSPISVVNNPVSGVWYFSSIIGVCSTNRYEVFHTYVSAGASAGQSMEVDFAGAFNVSQMKLKGVKDDNGTPFTLLTNAQIKTQLDLWVSKGIIPNDNLLSVNMNKRVRSVSSDTLTTSDLYLQANTKGYSLPNGVKDTIEYRNGKYYYVQRVKKYTLQASDVISVSPLTNVVWVSITKRSDDALIGNTATSITTSLYYYIKGYMLGSNIDDVLTNVGTYHNWSSTTFRIGFPSGTSIAQAQSDLAGTDIYYQLAAPIETEIEAWGNLQGYESGIVYVDDIKIDASIYASGVTTTSEIKSLKEIVKITNGVETQLDTSLAVIAVDKLSFTHPSLVDGDYVWFAYEEDGNYYKATTDITYYIDKLVRTSPDGSVWKLDWSVDNSGVITWTPTKI